MAFNKLKNMFGDKESLPSEDEYYNLTTEKALKDLASEGTKLILLEPRAFSESQQIADHLIVGADAAMTDSPPTG